MLELLRGWTVVDLIGTDIFWIYVKLFLNVLPVTAEKQDVSSLKTGE